MQGEMFGQRASAAGRATRVDRLGRRVSQKAAASLLVLLSGAAAAACGSATSGTNAGTGTAPSATGASGTSGTAATTPPATTPTTAPVAPPLARGKQGPGSAIPWNAVGPGWSVALWNAGSTSQGTTVFVVDPAGGRYAAATIPSSIQYPVIADWSGDKHRILVSYTSSTTGGTSVIDLDLTTGATLGNFALNGLGSVRTVNFSRPDGLAIIAGSYQSRGGRPVRWQRYSPTGSVEMTFPETFPKVGDTMDTAVETPDGNSIVIGATKGVALVSNNGSVEAEMPVPGVTSGCEVMRWWQPGEVLAQCSTEAAQAFWAIPVAGGAPTKIVPASNQGDAFNVWEVGGVLYAQEGACGTVWIDTLSPTGVPTRVNVPGASASGSQQLVGVNGNDIEVRAASSCDTAGKPITPSLMWWNVSSNTSTVILGAPLNGGNVISAFTYDAEGY